MKSALWAFFFSSSYGDDILIVVTNRSWYALLLQRRRDSRLPRIRRWVECVQQPRWPRRKIKMYVYLMCSVYVIHLFVWSLLLVAFKVYDVDRDGYISNGELFLVLKMMVGNNLKVCIISCFVTVAYGWAFYIAMHVFNTNNTIHFYLGSTTPTNSW